ncbi:MAG: class D sortase [Chloroflexi bacterium]|nr:class D sortase [Chloroflexota bacterium]
MARRKAPEDLSVEELRRLLVEKRRGSRKERLEHFRRTGRVADATSENFPSVDTRDGSDLLAAPVSPRRRFLDGVLLAVEVLAVVGIIGVLLSGFGLLQDLNREVTAALNPVTPTPTPLVMAVILPSGHTPPDAQGNTRPNEAEIPEHLRPMVQSLENIPAPPPSAAQAIRIQIPSLKVDAPVIQGDGWEQLKKGVAQHIGTANPGETGNMVVSAHNDVYGELFRYLDRLKPGDQVIVYTQQRQYVYVVDRTVIVKPTQVEVMASTADPTITLISCYPYLVDTDRIVVFAKLLN